MALVERKLTDQETYELLIRIDEGYLVTAAEKKMLNSVTNLDWSGSNITKLPNSMRLLASLSGLGLSRTEVSDISSLSSLTSLEFIHLDCTKVSDISALSNLTSLMYLDLSGTKVRDISVLSNLTSLTTLYLGGTKVSDISVLSKLTSLSRLGLRGTKVRDISVLSKLTSLSRLGLRGTNVSDISVLSKLTEMSHLDLSDTEVNDISAVSKFTSLISLELNDTPVSDISALSNLTSLMYLELNRTRVSDISALSGLYNLVTLELSGIVIKDLSVLSRLFALRRLNIQDSITTSIPKSLIDLGLSIITEERSKFSYLSQGIYIHGLIITDQPIEIFSQGNELIHEYLREGDQVPVNECKVIFLGDAESGKTHSIRRLLENGEFLKDFDGGSTPGIEITVNPAKLDNTDIVINYWDFGGQEIQHSMHRVFLTERTVYVVFLNARQDDLMDERARYWMENIKAFAPDAPVLVVINKIDQNEHPRFNEKGFIDSYGEQVKKIIRLSQSLFQIKQIE